MGRNGRYLQHRPPIGNTLNSTGSISANSWVEINVTSLITGDGQFSLALTTSDANQHGSTHGHASDIFVCTPTSLGENTSCTYSLFWSDGSFGLSGLAIDAMSID